MIMPIEVIHVIDLIAVKELSLTDVNSENK